MGKRVRDPDEAPQPRNKLPRVNKKSQPSDPVPQRNPRQGNEEMSGGPGPSSEQGRLQRKRSIPPMPQTLPASSPVKSTDSESGDSDISTCYSQDVTAYDVGQDVQAVGTPQADDSEFWGPKTGPAEFIRSRSGLEENWVGVRPLGRGGNAIAGLWELRGDDGQAIKQMVVKEETYMREEWKDEVASGIPREVKAMSKLNKIHCYAIPRLFGYKRYPHVYKHRMYMEFCGFKDLSVLCKRYRRFRQHLPEPFLWDVFYHLVEAAAAMRDGAGDDEWDFEIVHRDVKPANVFLAEPNAEKGFHFYPVAKLGDFGLAIMTNNEDSLNPVLYWEAGTEGYLAPEQSQEEGMIHAHLSASTNVWAIGATMLELLTLYRHADQMADSAYNDNGVIRTIETTKEPEYSRSLRSLIVKCIKRRPSKRIGLDRLRSRIQSHREGLRKEYEELDEASKVRFRADSRLYYVRNEINDMPTGYWVPHRAKSPSRPESGKFPDREFPVVYPRFHDGPEGYGDDEQETTAPISRGRRPSDPILLDDTGDTIRRRRLRAKRAPVPVFDEWDDEGTDDEEWDMDLEDEDEDPVSPTPITNTEPPAAAVTQVPQPQALAAPALAPTLAPAPAIVNVNGAVPAVVQAQVQAPDAERVPRTLRNGKVRGYF